MSQNTFNRVIAITALIAVVAFFFRQMSDQTVNVFSYEIPMWGTALIVIATGLVIYRIKSLALKEARQNSK